MTPTDDEKLLIYFDSEEHLVRRLGAAVVSCWRDLAPDFRAQLIERAKRVLDDETDEELDAHIERFITVHDSKSSSGRKNAA